LFDIYVKDLVDLGIVFAHLFYHNTADRRVTFQHGPEKSGYW